MGWGGAQDGAQSQPLNPAGRAQTTAPSARLHLGLPNPGSLGPPIFPPEHLETPDRMSTCLSLQRTEAVAPLPRPGLRTCLARSRCSEKNAK